MLDKEGNANDGYDEDGGNMTGHLTFNPYYNSTSGPSGDQYEKATMNREGEKAPETAKTSFIDGDSFKQEQLWQTYNLKKSFLNMVKMLKY